MQTLQMLNVAIGIIFIYLLLSLICTALNELIEKFLKKRASDLHRGICELIQDNSQNNLLEKLYKHPLIYGLYKGKYSQTSTSNLPSYIPSANFALALMDTILPASSSNLSGAAGGNLVKQQLTGRILEASEADDTSAQIRNTAVDTSAQISNEAGISDDHGAGAARPGALVEGAVGEGAPVIKSINTVETLRKALVNWPDSSVKQALLTLIDSAEGDINKARHNIETWYNSSMDRVSGWYKRRVQMITIAVGFLLAVALNADTIAIFKGLLNNPTLQNSLVAASGEYAKTQQALADSSQANAEDRFEKNIQKLNELRLPIGWDFEKPKQTGTVNSYLTNYNLAIPSTCWGWFRKLIGLFITAMAISLGAPFWFDTLNRFMVIRSTVKPHEKSQDESSEDRQKTVQPK